MQIELRMQPHGLLYWCHYVEYADRLVWQLLLIPTTPDKVLGSVVPAAALGNVKSYRMWPFGTTHAGWMSRTMPALAVRHQPPISHDIGDAKAWLLAVVAETLRQRVIKFEYRSPFQKTFLWEPVTCL